MKRLKEAVQKVLKSAIRVTLNLFQGLIIRKMRSRNKFGMTLFQTLGTASYFEWFSLPSPYSNFSMVP